MELISGQNFTCWLCSNCGFKKEKLVQISIGNRLCQNCLIKAFLMINPIKFDKEKVNEWLMINVISDDNSANEEGLSEGLYSFDVKHFIEFIETFLESK